MEQNYADPVDPDKAIYGPQRHATSGAIPGALRTLDPHSNFYDPRAFAAAPRRPGGQVLRRGHADRARPGKLGKLMIIVVAPIPGSPAFRAGLRPGDIIAKVNGKSTDGLNTAQVAEKLRDPRARRCTSPSFARATTSPSKSTSPATRFRKIVWMTRS